MKLKKIFENFKIEGIRLKTSAAEFEISYENHDKECAWLMYVELLTRITTQKLDKDKGDEATALESVHKLFQITRDILKSNGRKATSFCKIAIIILNQKVRPFTSKWHKLMIDGAFNDEDKCILFREELESLRGVLVGYTKLLADMADVEDLTEIIFD